VIVLRFQRGAFALVGQDAARRVTDKPGELLAQGILSELIFDQRDGGCVGVAIPVEDVERLFERLNVVTQTCTTQPDYVERRYVVTEVSDAEGGQVEVDADGAADKGETTDAGELLDAAGWADDGLVLELDVPCDPSQGGDDAVVTDNTVVADVASVHDEVAIADARRIVFDGSVNGAVFTERVVVADDQTRAGLIGGVGFMLRGIADAGKRIDQVVGAQGQWTLEHDVGHQAGA